MEMEPISKLLLTYRYMLSISEFVFDNSVNQCARFTTPSAMCCDVVITFKNFGFAKTSLKSRSTYDIPALAPSSLTGSFSSASKVGQTVSSPGSKNQKLGGILTEKESINAPSGESCTSQR